ncbi:MAG: hypothetical protein KAQ98_01920 [Bacteriovoracaceae bacterium]|nr:hypothetical protein [Bacteriovoracaceae bacterium]
MNDNSQKPVKNRKRSYAGLVVRAFFYSIIPTFIFYMFKVRMGIHPEVALARGFVGFFLLIFGVLMIQKKIKKL